MSRIQVESRAHAEATYAALRRLPLPGDAADLSREDPPERRAREDTLPPHLAGLLAAYRRVPAQTWLHGVALCVDDSAGLLAWLEHPTQRSPALRDPPACALTAALLEVLRADHRDTLDGAGPPLPAHAAEVAARLDPLRAALWEGRAAPPLAIWHCPSLGTRGRAISGAFGRRVAIDLGQPVLDAVFVALHEETHAVSDALSVPDRAARLRRDTRRGAPGADVHATLEAAAVVVAAAVVEARAPELVEAYRQWERRWLGEYEIGSGAPSRGRPRTATQDFA